MNTDNRTLQPGCPALWDTFAGLVPCRVDAIEGADRPDGRPSSDQSARFTVTQDHGPYKKGEQHSAWVLHVVPRGAIVRGQYSSSRIGAYRVQGGKAC